jgi:hypothetical protein
MDRDFDVRSFVTGILIGLGLICVFCAGVTIAGHLQ